MNNDACTPTVNDYLSASPHALRKTGGRRLAGSKPNKIDVSLPLVTVYTVVLNRKSTVRKTIESVLHQTYPNIEYIVVDGASTDGTLDVIIEFEDKIDFWLSEPDLGPTDAANKAISHALGDFVFWLSSDDWVDSNYIELALGTMTATGADFVYGNSIVYRGEVPAFVVLGDPKYAKSITYRMPHLNTSSMVIKRDCFPMVGLFNLKYPLASDYEWALRLHVRGGRGTYDKRLSVHYRLGGASNINYFEGLLEVRRASIEHGFSRTKATCAVVYQIMRRKLRQVADVCLPAAVFNRIANTIRIEQASGSE